MSQLSLLAPIAPSIDDILDELQSSYLRWYQEDAVNAAMAALTTQRSTVIVAATGTGKTTIFADIAQRWPGRVLVLAHRSELVHQAAHRIRRQTGEEVGIEQRGRCSDGERIVVASVQSIFTEDRMNTMERHGGTFALVIVDECHHYVSKRFRAPLDHFKAAKILGVTATIDRSDNKALGQVFDSVAYSYHIGRGVEDGYLVRPVAQEIFMEKMDISEVKSSRGEGGLNVAELDDEMVKSGDEIADGMIKYAGDRQGIVFTPGVKTAHYVAEAINARGIPGSAAAVDGKTPLDERAMVLARFSRGEIQFLVNCMIFTEGFDAPSAAVVGLARPTKSRSLATQMIGRILRVLPGVIDHVKGPDEGGTRRAAIAASKKPNGLILNFVGEAGKHDLIGPDDIFEGEFTDAERARAKKKKKDQEGESDVIDDLRNARKELEALAKSRQIKAQSRADKYDPLAVFNIDHSQIDDDMVKFGQRPVGDNMKAYLAAKGLSANEIAAMKFPQAMKMIKALKVRQEKGLSTYKQQKQLARFGVTDPNVPFDRASAAMSYIIAKGFGKRGKIDRDTLLRIVERSRQPGEDG